MPDFSGLYHRFYELVAGRGVGIRPWHFRWLAAYYLHRDLREPLSRVRGKLLDVGCGRKPYSAFLHPSVEHVGVDITPGGCVDVVITENRIPFPDSCFDAVLCTQVLEHVEDPYKLRDEVIRCLKPGGLLVASVPFIYNEHGAPFDFKRFSRHGITAFFGQGIDISKVDLQGGIGSTLGFLALNWIDTQMSRSQVTKLLKAVLLPPLLALSFAVNVIGYIWDRIDTTGSFYNNVLITGTKKETS